MECNAKHKTAKETEFWKSMIKKHEDRNAQLVEQQCDLRHRLEAMECSMPGLLCFNMMQLAKSKPGADLSNFVAQLQQPAEKQSGPLNLDCTCDPCPLHLLDEPQRRADASQEPAKEQPRADVNIEDYDCDCRPVKGPNTKEKDQTFSDNDANVKDCSCDPTSRNPPVNFDALSAYSLKPADINYMERIKGLVEREKLLKHDIEELEHKEKAYSETLKQADDIFAAGPDHGDYQAQSLNYSNQQLMESNRDLEEQLEDAKLELKQAKENLEGPLKREIEKERRRCQQLEDQLKKASAAQSDKESAHRKELDFLNKQLRSANQNLSDLNVLNKRLKEELCMLNCRCNELQTDLINQKLSEVHTISRLTAMNQMKPGDGKPKPPKPPSPPRGPSGEGDDLNTIARNLSLILAEATDCDNCQNFNPDLIDTVKYIKSLVDLVNKDGADGEQPASKDKVDLKPTVELYPPKDMPSSESTVGFDAELGVAEKIPSKKSSVLEPIAKSASLTEEPAPREVEDSDVDFVESKTPEKESAELVEEIEGPAAEEEPEAGTGEPSIGPEKEAEAVEEAQVSSADEGGDADQVEEHEVPEDVPMSKEVLEDDVVVFTEELPEVAVVPISKEVQEDDVDQVTEEVQEDDVQVTEELPEEDVVLATEELPEEDVVVVTELPEENVVLLTEELPEEDVVVLTEEVREDEPALVEEQAEELDVLPPSEPHEVTATPPSSVESITRPIEPDKEPVEELAKVDSSIKEVESPERPEIPGGGEAKIEEVPKQVSKVPSLVEDVPKKVSKAPSLVEDIETTKQPSKVPSLRGKISPVQPPTEVVETPVAVPVEVPPIKSLSKEFVGPIDVIAEKPKTREPEPPIEDAAKPSVAHVPTPTLETAEEIHKPTEKAVTKPSIEDTSKPVDVIKPKEVSAKPSVVESPKSPSTKSLVFDHDVQPDKRVDRSEPPTRAVASTEEVFVRDDVQKLTTKPASKESLKPASKPSSRRPSQVSAKKPSETGVSTAHVREDVKVLKSAEKIPTREDIEVVTELQTEGDIDVDTEVHLVRRSTDGVFVTTTVTSTGQLEVMTEGPAGVIDTTLKLTDSGNIEVVTEVTEYEGTSAVISHSAKAIDVASSEARKPESPPLARSRTSSERSATAIDVLHAPPPAADKKSEVSVRSRRSSKMEEGEPGKEAKGVCPCPQPKQLSDKSVTIGEPLEEPIIREEPPEHAEEDDIIDLTSDKVEETIEDEAVPETDVTKEDKEMEAIPEQSEINVQSDEPEALQQDDKPTETDDVVHVEDNCQCDEERIVEVDVCICDGETETPKVDKSEVICQCEDGDKAVKETETTNVDIAHVNLQYDEADKHVCVCDRGIEAQARSKEAFSQADDAKDVMIPPVVVSEVEPEAEIKCTCDDEEDDEDKGDETAGDDVDEEVEYEEEDDESGDECVCKPGDATAESDDYCKCEDENDLNLPASDRKSVGFVNKTAEESSTGSGSTASEVSLFSDLTGAVELGPNIAHVLERASLRVSGVLERAGMELETVLNEHRRSGILKNSQMNIMQSDMAVPQLMTGDSKAVCTCSKKTGNPKKEKRKRKREKVDKADAPKEKRSKTKKVCTCRSKSTDVSTPDSTRARRPISPTFSGPSRPSTIGTCASETSKSKSICTCRPPSPEHRIICICRPTSPNASESSKSRSICMCRPSSSDATKSKSICTCRSSSPDSSQKSRSSCACGQTKTICRCRPGSPDSRNKSRNICTCRPRSPDAKSGSQTIRSCSSRPSSASSYREHSNTCKCARRTRREPDSVGEEILASGLRVDDSSTEETPGNTYCKDASDATTTTAKCMKGTCPSQTDSTGIKPDVQDTSTNTLKACNITTCEHQKSQTDYLTSSEGDSECSDIPSSRKISCPGKAGSGGSKVRPFSAGSIRENATNTSKTQGTSCKRCSSFSVQQSSSTVETMDSQCVTTCSRYAQKPSETRHDSLEDACEPTCSKFPEAPSPMEYPCPSSCPRFGQESSSIEFPCTATCPRFGQKSPSDEYPCPSNCTRFLQKSSSTEYPCPSNCRRFAPIQQGENYDHPETFHTPPSSITHFLEVPPKLDLTRTCTASTCGGKQKKLDLTRTCTASTCIGMKTKKSPVKSAADKTMIGVVASALPGAIQLVDSSATDSPTNDSVTPVTDSASEVPSTSSSGCTLVTCERAAMTQRPPSLSDTSSKTTSEQSSTFDSSDSVCGPATCRLQQVIVEARPSATSKISSQQTQPSGKSSKSETFATPTGISETSTAEPPDKASEPSSTGSSKLQPEETQKSTSSTEEKIPSKIPSVASQEQKAPETSEEDKIVPSRTPSVPSRIPSVTSEGRKTSISSRTASVKSEGRKIPSPTKIPSAAPSKTPSTTVEPVKTASLTGDGRKIPKQPSKTATDASPKPDAAGAFPCHCKPGEERREEPPVPKSVSKERPLPPVDEDRPKISVKPPEQPVPKSVSKERPLPSTDEDQQKIPVKPPEQPVPKSVSKERPLPSTDEDQPKIPIKPPEVDRLPAKELQPEVKKASSKIVSKESPPAVKELSPTKVRSRTSSIKAIPMKQPIPEAAEPKKRDVPEVEVTVTVQDDTPRKHAEGVAISIEREVPAETKKPQVIEPPSVELLPEPVDDKEGRKRSVPGVKPVGEAETLKARESPVSRRSDGSKQSITKPPTKTPSAEKPSKKAGDAPPSKTTSDASRKSAGEVSRASSRRADLKAPDENAFRPESDVTASKSSISEPRDVEQPPEEPPKMTPEEPPGDDVDRLSGKRSITKTPTGSIEVVKTVEDLDNISGKRSSRSSARSGKESVSKIPISSESTRAPSVKSALSAKSVPSLKSEASTGAEGDSKAKTPSMKSRELEDDSKSKASSVQLAGDSKSRTSSVKLSSESSKESSKSRIPVPVSKIASQGSHPSICDCLECIFEKAKQLVKPVDEVKPHGADCLCIDCLCDPNKFAPRVETVAPVIIDETVGLKRHSSSCECIDCLCSPCRDPDKPKKQQQHSEDCNCVDCLCTPCIEQPCPSLPKVKRHPPECKCDKCVCDPCGDMPDCSCEVCKCSLCGDVTKRLTKSGKKRHPDCRCPECICETCKKEQACTCPDCKCDPCKDEQVQARNLVKRGHVPGCTCPVCKCNPCADVNAVRHDPNCDCAMCTCEPCYQPPPPRKESTSKDATAQSETPRMKSEVKVQTVSEEKRQAGAQVSMTPQQNDLAVEAVKKHAPTCTCPECICEPCSDPIVEDAKKNKHRANCDCAECKCAPCGDPAVVNAKSKHGPGCMCPQCICDPCNLPMKKHGAGCICPECICEPCTDPAVEAAKTHGVGCKCPQCICEPCYSNVGAVKSKHGPNCTCAECKCAPCSDSAVKDAKTKHEPGCKCPQCVCDDLSGGASKRPNKHGEGCQCPECICEPCNDTSVEDAKKNSNKPKHTPTCRCPECSCEPCSDPSVKGKTKHVPNCKCPECTCDPCSDPLSKFKPKHGPECDCTECIADAHPSACDCPECICDPCADPAVQAAKKHGKGCKCQKCTCDPCDPRGEPSIYTKPKIECKPLTPSKPAIQRKLDAKCVCDEPAVPHEPECKCSKCMCKPCNPSNKESAPPKIKCKEQPAPITGDDTGLSAIPEECVCFDASKKAGKSGRKNPRRQKEVEELKGLMDQIRCACQDAELQASMTAPSFKTTLSGMQVALNSLQDKCKTKDKMIEAMAQELKLRANSSVFNEMLKQMASSPNVAVDYDMQTVCEVLPRPALEARSQSRADCSCDLLDTSPMKITNVRRIAPDSILVKWDPPANKSVNGYEVCVDGAVKSRVHSAQRTSAVVFTLEMKNKVYLSVYALTANGRCETPATYVYNV